MKYYWVSFTVDKVVWSGIKGVAATSSEISFQEVTKVMPLRLQRDLNEKFGKTRKYEPPVGYTTSESYTLLNWKEITLEEYAEFEKEF